MRCFKLLHPFFQSAYGLSEFRKPWNHGLRLHPNFMRHDGSAGDDLVRFEVSVHACASGNHNLIADDEVVCQSCLSTDHDMMSHASTAGDSDLCHEN